MNRECLGTYFNFLERTFYRCLLDGKVIEVEGEYVEYEICPVCSRQVDAGTARVTNITLSNGYVLHMEQFQ